MDIQRPAAVARARRIRRIVYIVLTLGLIGAISLGVSRLRPAAPEVDMATVWPDTVKRGPLILNVRGMGTLVPEASMLIPATTEGRIERILLKPGVQVQPNTVLLQLSNPVLELDAVDTEFRLKGAEADYTDLKVRLESARLTQESTAAQVQAQYAQAKLQADRDEALTKQGLLPDLNYRLSKVTADELAVRHQIEQKRLSINSESVEAQLAAQRVKVDQLRALYALKRSQLDALNVRAGAEGVLQQLPVPIEVGQRVAPGTPLAKVVDPKRLKAELKVAETQAKDIVYGQPASIDTRNGFVPGHVSRIEQTAQNGTVTVDVTLEGALPLGSRPDLSVDGTITTAKLDDVLYVGRPAFGQEKSTITLFKIEPDGTHASKVQVQLGRHSVNFIEIVAGLKVGDRVILSDMSAQDSVDRIRLR
jgi:HlyD family secretion protein